MIAHAGFYWIPILPREMRATLARLPRDKKRWPKDFRDRYRSLHADFSASKATFVALARKDRDSRMTRTAKLLLSYLVDCLNFDSGRCDPSQQAIADEIGVCVRTVERVVKQLASAGWLAVSRRGATATNFYRLRVVADKLAAIQEDSAARRDIRRAASKLRRQRKNDPTLLSDQNEKHPTPMSCHDRTSMPVDDPTCMSAEPMKGTSEAEPVNEQKEKDHREDTYRVEVVGEDQASVADRSNVIDLAAVTAKRAPSVRPEQSDKGASA